ncbi:isocyanide synthase family protein [Iodobacter fluviatilis]|uniref:Pyoverdine biosynthesis protein PvcA n=1 Tax=Iodobacter fluviatilis TaxID=537 RepID=A0A7G3GE38_9NEIS|nr:isocyanide synthase family protein [Iodobacter fluviatilis]QBC45404.1 pyoverdine biosynthesis protein PvcA [Iodobacter fluviatilis]
MIPPLKHDSVANTTKAILNILLRHRRELYPNARHQYLPQQEQIRRLVQTGETIQLTLPAFPCKSPNSDKVLGDLPDMAERMSLRFLKQLCDEIEKVYVAGARVLICSDGHVFGDLIQVNDSTINGYTAGLIDMINTEQISCIDIFQLGHVYHQVDFDTQRALLVEEWARPLPVLREEVTSNEYQNKLYRGITRFLLEDACLSVGMSKSALQRLSKTRALAVMQRSEAWGNLIAHHHPCTVRLSIHPQPPGSAKLGIMLLNATDTWVTPWHAVLVDSGNSTLLMKHREAKQIGNLVRENGRPSHYVIPNEYRC